MEELHRVLAADSRILQIDEIATMHLGPQAILMALTLRFRSEPLDSRLWTTQYGKSLQLCNLLRNVSPMSMSGPGPTRVLSLRQKPYPNIRAILRSELIRTRRLHFEGIEIGQSPQGQRYSGLSGFCKVV